MALRDLTRDDVLAAVAEFDRLGRDAFLDQYGFGQAKTYFLEVGGARYVNVTGTLNVLMALDAAGGGRAPAAFVLASTNVVCGSRNVGVLSEDLDLHPESPYAASKVAAEQMVAAYAATGAIGAVTLRCFNIAGGGRWRRRYRPDVDHPEHLPGDDRRAAARHCERRRLRRPRLRPCC